MNKAQRKQLSSICQLIEDQLAGLEEIWNDEESKGFNVPEHMAEQFEENSMIIEDCQTEIFQQLETLREL